MHDRPPLRVVIADDHELLRSELCTDLEREGFAVVAVAADGVEAVAAAVRERPDLCLLDVRMPGRGGIEAAGEITRRLPETKVVLLTSAREEGDALAAARAGAVGFVLKDIDARHLADVLRDVADGGLCFPRTLVARLAAHLRARNGVEDQPGDRERVLRLLEEGVPAREMPILLSLSRATVERQLGLLAGDLRALPAR